jgi:hypothetical protein
MKRFAADRRKLNWEYGFCRIAARSGKYLNYVSPVAQGSGRRRFLCRDRRVPATFLAQRPQRPNPADTECAANGGTFEKDRRLEETGRFPSSMRRSRARAYPAESLDRMLKDAEGFGEGANADGVIQSLGARLSASPHPVYPVHPVSAWNDCAESEPTARRWRPYDVRMARSGDAGFHFRAFGRIEASRRPGPAHTHVMQNPGLGVGIPWTSDEAARNGITHTGYSPR